MQKNDDTAAQPSAHTQISPLHHGCLDAINSRYFLFRITQHLFSYRYHHAITTVLHTVELLVMHSIVAHPSSRLVKPHIHTASVFVKRPTVYRQQTLSTIIFPHR